jgi:hypothetical protein
VCEVLAVRLSEDAERIKQGTNKGQLAKALEKEQVGPAAGRQHARTRLRVCFIGSKACKSGLKAACVFTSFVVKACVCL